MPPTKAPPPLKQSASPYCGTYGRRNSTGKLKTHNSSLKTSSREMWLESLKSGADMRNNPVKAVYSPSRNSLASSMGSKADFLHELQSQKSLRKSVKSATPTYKPQEDMYDEIIQLKKNIVMDKAEIDVLKAKLRRLEEENKRKDKCIDELTDYATSEKSRVDAKLISRTLKQRQSKLEHDIAEKDLELKSAKDRIKDLRSKARKAKLAYAEEVSELQEALRCHGDEIGSQQALSDRRLVADGGSRSEKSFRETVLKLSGRNSQLEDEIQTLKRDLDQALGRAKQTSKVEKDDKEWYESEVKRLKSIVKRLKEDNLELRKENSEQLLKTERQQEDLEKLKEEKMDLQRHCDKMLAAQESHERRLKAAEKVTMHLRQQEKAATSIQRSWRKHHEKKNLEAEEAVSLIQSSLQGHFARQQFMNSQATTAGHGPTPDLTSDDVTLLQATMRGHVARIERMSEDG